VNKELNERLRTIASDNQLLFSAIWGIEGGKGWLWVKQDEKNDYTIQVYTNRKFDDYNRIKEELVNVFSNMNCILNDEIVVSEKGWGYRKNLIFIDHSKYEENIKKEEEQSDKLRPQYIGTQIGEIHQIQGSVQVGDSNSAVSNSSTEDKKWFQKEIVKMILSFISGVGVTILSQ